MGGKELLLFGPFADFSPRVLKTGRISDVCRMIKCHNLGTMICASLQNLDLVFYLLSLSMATKKSRMKNLHNIMPSAQPDDWTLITAGMRVQIIKKDKGTKDKPGSGKYIFQFGTEVVFGPEHNICGLLGASPGASTAVQVCFDILQKAYAKEMPGWTPKLKEMVPSFGMKLSENPQEAVRLLKSTAHDLGITYQ